MVTMKALWAQSREHRMTRRKDMPEQEETLETIRVKSYREAQCMASRYGIYISGFTNPSLRIVGVKVVREKPLATITVTKEEDPSSRYVNLCVALTYQGEKPVVSEGFSLLERVS